MPAALDTPWIIIKQPSRAPCERKHRVPDINLRSQSTYRKVFLYTPQTSNLTSIPLNMQFITIFLALLTAVPTITAAPTTLDLSTAVVPKPADAPDLDPSTSPARRSVSCP